jgi:hypothetical protein
MGWGTPVTTATEEDKAGLTSSRSAWAIWETGSRNKGPGM